VLTTCLILLGLLSNPEDAFLQSIVWLLLDYIELYPKRRIPSQLGISLQCAPVASYS
jgi:hypothetical protein